MDSDILTHANAFRNLGLVVLSLQHHLSILNNQLNKIDDEAVIHVSRSKLGYGSMAEWASEMQSWSSDVAHCMMTFNGIGAAVTYTTIFSATRGSLALMSWSFATFFVALVLPAGIQGFLAWATTVPSNTRFPSQQMYNIFVGIAMGISWMSSIVAVHLLLFSVYYLCSPEDALVEAVPHEIAQQLTDAVPTNVVKWPSLLAIVILSSSCALILLTHLGLLWGNGWKCFAKVYYHEKPKENVDHEISDRTFPW